MKFLDILRTANSNLFRNKLRSFLTILAIFIGSFTIILTSGIQTGVNDYIDTQVAAAGGEGYIEIFPLALMQQMGNIMGGSGDPIEYSPEENSAEMQIITEEDMDRIRAIDGIESVRGFQRVSAEYIRSDRVNRKFLLNVTVLPTDRINLDLAAGRTLDINSDTSEIVLLPRFSQALGFDSDEDAVGKTVRIGVVDMVTNEISEIEATIAGILNPSVINMGQHWVNNALSDKMIDIMYANLPDSLRNTFTIATAEFDPNLTEDEIQRLQDDLEEIGFFSMTIDDQVGMIKTFFDAIIMVFTIFGAIALLAASIGIINTLFMAVQERTREIGLMKAMGLSKGKIFTMFSFEAIALGFWGSVVGISLAYIAGTIANRIAAETFLSNLPGFTLIKFDAPSMIIITLVIMSIAFLAGTLPARRAARKDPIEALRYE